MLKGKYFAREEEKGSGNSNSGLSGLAQREKGGRRSGRGEDARENSAAREEKKRATHTIRSARSAEEMEVVEQSEYDSDPNRWKDVLDWAEEQDSMMREMQI